MARRGTGVGAACNSSRERACALTLRHRCRCQADVAAAVRDYSRLLDAGLEEEEQQQQQASGQGEGGSRQRVAGAWDPLRQGLKGPGFPVTRAAIMPAAAELRRALAAAGEAFAANMECKDEVNRCVAPPWAAGGVASGGRACGGDAAPGAAERHGPSSPSGNSAGTWPG